MMEDRSQSHIRPILQIHSIHHLSFIHFSDTNVMFADVAEMKK